MVVCFNKIEVKQKKGAFGNFSSLDIWLTGFISKYFYKVNLPAHNIIEGAGKDVSNLGCLNMD